MTGDPLTVLAQAHRNPGVCIFGGRPEDCVVCSALAAVEALVADLRAIQAVAVMSQSPHAEQLRLEWLREIEDRSREALARFPATSPAKEKA